jgi:hypothetical protein
VYVVPGTCIKEFLIYSFFQTQSEDDEWNEARRRRRAWRSKHKNVIDPVFLGELEHLIQVHTLSSSVPDPNPDPRDPHVFGPHGSVY